MGTTAKWALRWPAASDPPAGNTQIQALAEDAENLMGPLATTVALKPSAVTSKSARQHLETDTGRWSISDGTNWFGIARVFELGHSWALQGQIFVPAGNVDIIPQIFIPVFPTLQVAKLKRVRYGIVSGTSATFKMQRNGADITGLTGLVAAPTVTETALGTPLALSNNDRLQPVVTAVAGTPLHLSITAVVEHTF